MKRIQLENRTDLKSEIPLNTPYVIFIDPSSACNFKCKFCMNHKIAKPEIISFRLYQEIIEGLHEFKKPVKTIRLYGFGEPLVNPNFCAMVKLAKRSEKVLSVDTTTNASRLTRGLNEELVESGIDRINISINGINTEQYKIFTGRDINFQKLVSMIEHLYSIRRDTIIYIKVNGDYLTDEDQNQFYDIFTPISDGCDIEHTMSCWYDMEVENTNKDFGVYGQPREDVKVCPYIFYSFMIHADGRASICFLDWNKRMIVGDARTQTVGHIWNSIDFKSYRIEMLKGIKNNICANCDQLRAGMPINLDAYAEEILKRL